jgi:serine/threonine protein kinase
MEENITFPESVFFKSSGIINFDIEKPYENVISIDNIDYIFYYLNNLQPGNKGSNSNVLKLIRAEEFDIDEGYPEESDLVIKISKFWKNKSFEHDRSVKFKREIDTLINCNKDRLPNTMKIYNFGLANLMNDENIKKYFWYYTMPYAPYDLTKYLEIRNLDLLEKIDLCIEICESLEMLWSKKYYHRDIKPDNILFTNDTWVLSDLGLSRNRDEDFDIDIKGDWVGPRGWMSPEAMNKYLCEIKPWSSLHDTKINHQSDIFQLGKVFWYIFQGNCPEGSVRRNDFLWKNEKLYQIIRTMLNHSKSSRYKEISEVIKELKSLSKKLFLNYESQYLYKI